MIKQQQREFFTGRLHRGGLTAHPIAYMTKQTPSGLRKARRRSADFSFSHK